MPNYPYITTPLDPSSLVAAFNNIIIEINAVSAGGSGGGGGTTIALVNSALSIYNAKSDGGAIGDGGADDTAALQASIIACFGNRAAPIASTAYRHLFIPAGSYKITAPLLFESLSGGLISGAGRFATKIFTTQANGSVIKTNGFQYSRFSDMSLTCLTGTGVCFDLDWDNTGTALQSNTFQNVFFDNGGYGVRIGNTGYMGSENLFLNCFWIRSTVGLTTQNYNALQNSIVGGNFQGCGTGVYVASGSVTLIAGTGFQVSGTTDIQASNGAGDSICIVGCRSESVNFISTTFAQTISISGCTQTNSTPGIFITGNSSASLDTCVSKNGQVLIAGGDIRNCQFNRVDWIAAAGGANRAVNVSSTMVGESGSLGSGQTGVGAFLERGTVRGSVYTPNDVNPFYTFYEFTTNRGFAANANLASSVSDFTMVRASTGYDLLGAASFAANAFRRNATGLLIEPAATNLILHSQDTTGWTVAGLALTNNAATAPDGTATASSMAIDASFGQHVDYNTTPISLTGGTKYIVSRFVKQSAGTQARYVHFGIEDATPSNGFWQEFDILNGVTTANSGSIGTGTLTYAEILNCGGGWFYISVAGIPNTATVTNYVPLYMVKAGGNSLHAASFIGDNASVLLTWGAGLQLDNALDNINSYIPTTTASVTRAADAASCTIAAGFSNIKYTFSTGETQVVSVSPGAYTIPTNLKWPVIASMRVY